ncbi:hypothetical protein [Altibacter lentus]|uniref:hypothetical protein n=1 Tax=Altibacter lentus TaxID=1223410 RepID=UPI00054FD739|nr:hypothetical protein [Altibacter lentus]
MKTTFYFLALFGLLALCSSCLLGNSKDETPYKDEIDSTLLSRETAMQKASEQKNDGKKFFYIKDAENGMVMAKTPLPSNWTMDETPNASLPYRGPSQLKIYKTERYEYFYSNDSFTNQTAMQMGKQVSQPMSLEDIVTHQIKPAMEGRGYTFVTSYSLPGVVGFWNRFSQGMPQTNSQRTYYAIGSEYQGSNGLSIFILALQTFTQNNDGIIWSISTTHLEASHAYFSEAKDAYIYGVSNTELNPQWQQFKNGQLAANFKRNDAFYREQIMKSEAAHKQRMSMIAAQGNTSRSVGTIYSEISDISHAGFLNRSNINSDGHSKTVNMIAENTLIGNHATGEHYTVPSGTNHYWVNNRGEYIGTNNSLYDPRIDNKINSTEWTKFDVEQ